MYFNNIDIKEINKILIARVKPYLIYLFGSSVTESFNDDSDVDIAFLSDNEVSDYEIFLVAQEIADALHREVDLINLSKSSTVFKVQVIGKGQVIYCTDDNRRMYFEMHAFKEYALLNEERQIILEEIKKRGSIYW